MNMKPVLFAIALCLSVLTFGHNYYVSIANMEYKEAENQVDVSLKMTAHDFEYLLEMKYNLRLHMEDIADSSEIGRFAQQYLGENFQLISGGEAAPMVYVGKEVTLRDELFFYFSFTGIKDPKTIQIKNQLLFTLFPQQQNIVHYKHGEKTKSVTLVPAAHTAEIKID
jgi:hypothetical protein